MTSSITDIRIADYTYDLPEARIAKFPLTKRDSAKLLVWNKGEIYDSEFARLPDFLSSKDLLVFNDSKVIKARLLFQRPTGAVSEVFCLSPAGKITIEEALDCRTRGLWHCLVRGLKRWNAGDKFRCASYSGLSAEVISKSDETAILAFSCVEDLSFAEVLERAGSVPLPPYLNRAAQNADTIRYQTVYAANPGSVAAPTAGLHFTRQLLERIASKGVQMEHVTLHVGAGTFMPVKTAGMAEHRMHSETVEVSKDFIKRLASGNERIIAVGTTSLRTLESLVLLAAASVKSGSIPLSVSQWDAFNDNEICTRTVLNNLAVQMSEANMDKLLFSTSLLLAPGCRFRMCGGLITNFHQSQSTLLLLVAAFTAAGFKDIYAHALAGQYRFLSFGDGSLLLRE